MNGSTAVVGWALCLTNSTTGEAEYMPIYDKHLSTDDASLTANRTVYGNGLTFGINGTGLFDVNSTSVSLQSAANGFMRIRTPKVTGGTAQAGQVLTLNPDMTVDFAAAGGAATLYTQDGTITDFTRVVNLGGSGRTLKFQGPGTLSAQTMTTIDFSASDAIDLKSTLGMVSLKSTAANGGGFTANQFGDTYVNAPYALYLNTPRASGASRPATGEVLAYDNATGRSEFKTVNDTSGIIEYYGNGSTSAGANTTFVVSDEKPTYAVADPAPWTRLTFRASFASGTQTDGASSYFVRFGDPGANSHEIVPLNGYKLKAGDIRNGTFVELIYDNNIGKWIMLNFGLGGFTTMERLQELLDRPLTGFAITNDTNAKVTTVAFAGVVDIFADLADVPTTFKKVSTLGLAEIDDGKADDYFLTAFNPDFIIPREGIRSAVDPKKMWKRLKR